jgi:hypothetical protein
MVVLILWLSLTSAKTQQQQNTSLGDCYNRSKVTATGIEIGIKRIQKRADGRLEVVMTATWREWRSDVMFMRDFLPGAIVVFDDNKRTIYCQTIYARFGRDFITRKTKSVDCRFETDACISGRSIGVMFGRVMTKPVLID